MEFISRSKDVGYILDIYIIYTHIIDSTYCTFEMVEPATSDSWSDCMPHKQISSIPIENQTQHEITSNHSDSRA